MKKKERLRSRIHATSSKWRRGCQRIYFYITPFISLSLFDVFLGGLMGGEGLLARSSGCVTELVHNTRVCVPYFAVHQTLCCWDDLERDDNPVQHGRCYGLSHKVAGVSFPEPDLCVVLDLVSRSLYIHTKEQYKSFGKFDFGKQEFDFTLNYYNYFYFYLHYFICLFIFFFMDLVIWKV